MTHIAFPFRAHIVVSNYKPPRRTYIIIVFIAPDSKAVFFAVGHGKLPALVGSERANPGRLSLAPKGKHSTPPFTLCRPPPAFFRGYNFPTLRATSRRNDDDDQRRTRLTIRIVIVIVIIGGVCARVCG